MRLATFVLLGLILPATAWSADTLMNLPARQGSQSATFIRQLVPGATVVLPNGQTTVIKSRLENGQLVTENGIIISRDGVIIEGADQGAFVIPAGQDNSLVRMEEENPQEINAAQLSRQEEPDLSMGQPEGENKEPDLSTGQAESENAETALSAESAAATNKADAKQEQAEKAEQRQEEQTVAVPGQTVQIPAGAAQDNSGKDKPLATNELLTLAELLPMTQVPAPEDSAGKAAKPAAKAKEENLPQEQVKARPAAQKSDPKAGAKHQKTRAEKKEDKDPPRQQEAKKAPQKTAPGKELRIPPDAAKTGNLAFLEGCWQGTRPEYYSKRTIKECFCFGANGKNGKRRVIDPIGGRRCIGSASAHLSQSGVLSVKSSGAACSDGERWGQAEMVCRNSGPRTPCSWVFADAQNGRQAYEIPFIRVESCGR